MTSPIQRHRHVDAPCVPGPTASLKPVDDVTYDAPLPAFADTRPDQGIEDMQRLNATIAVLAAALLASACSKKEEPADAAGAAVDAAVATEAAGVANSDAAAAAAVAGAAASDAAPASAGPPAAAADIASPIDPAADPVDITGTVDIPPPAPKTAQ